MKNLNYRELIQTYKNHLNALLDEKLSEDDAKILAAALAVDFAKRTSSYNSISSNEILEIRIKRLLIQGLKHVDDAELVLSVTKSDKSTVLIDFFGQQALRIIFLLKMHRNPKQLSFQTGFSELAIQKEESYFIKDNNLDIERTAANQLHRSINQKFKSNCGIKKFIQNTATRNRPGLWSIAIPLDKFKIDKPQSDQIESM